MAGPFVRLAVAIVPLLAGASGCAPTLRGYLKELEAGDIEGAPTRAEQPPPAAATAADEIPFPKSLVLCRFDDVRTWSERNYVGAYVADFFAAVMSIGIALVLDAADNEHRKQPIDGLDSELPRRLAERLVAGKLFASCEFEDLSHDVYLQRRASGRVPMNRDLLLHGQVSKFTGEWKLLDVPEVTAPDGSVVTPASTHWDYCRGRIEVTLNVTDLKSGKVVWTGVVTTTRDDVPRLDWKAEWTTGAFENRLAVFTFADFLDAVTAKLRTRFAPL